MPSLFGTVCPVFSSWTLQLVIVPFFQGQYNVQGLWSFGSFVSEEI
jgi:hypothetical protein